MDTVSQKATVENTGHELAPRPARATALSLLTQSPATTITSEDVSLPRIYVGQYTSTAVQNQLVKPGCIFAATDAEDPDPQVLYEHGGKDGVLIYPLGMLKGWSATIDGEFQTYGYEDPNVPENASLAYHYVLLVPAVDLDLPCRLTLSRTGARTAKKINTVLKRSEPEPPWVHAFLLTTSPRQNEMGKWFVAQATATTPDPGHVHHAGSLASMIATGASNAGHEAVNRPAEPNAPIEQIEPVHEESGDDDDKLPF